VAAEKIPLAVVTPSFERDTRPTFVAEGIYDHDPDDPGGETFRGIARVYHPLWAGWVVIDEIKQTVTPTVETLRKTLQNNVELERLALNFYRAEFWYPLRLDDVVDGRIAAALFDQGVNLSRERAGAHLQIALNALNRNATLYPDLVEDGQIGPNTLGSLKTYVTGEPLYEEAIGILLTMLGVLQGAHYFESMRQSPTKEKYARGFFKRVRLVAAA
jgi:lysozyme family protein